MKGRDLVKLLEPYLDMDITMMDQADDEWILDFVSPSARVIEVVEYESEGVRLLGWASNAPAGSRPVVVLCLDTVGSHESVAEIQAAREEAARAERVRKWVAQSTLDDKLDAALGTDRG